MKKWLVSFMVSIVLLHGCADKSLTLPTNDGPI